MSTDNTTSLPPGYDWARNVFLFDSIPAACIFAGICFIYLLAMCYCAYKTSFPAVRKLYIFGILWGLTRVIGLALRAVTLIGNNGSNTGLVTTTQILCSIGFLPLIRFLIFETLCILRANFPHVLADRIDRIQSIAFLVSTIMLVSSLIQYSQNLPAPITSKDEFMRNTSTWIFFGYAFAPTLLGAFLACNGSERQGGIMALTGFCLSIKMAFALSKNYVADFQATEAYFYVLNVAPELVMTTLYMTPRVLEEFAVEAEEARGHKEFKAPQGTAYNIPLQVYANAVTGQLQRHRDEESQQPPRYVQPGTYERKGT